MGDYLVFVIVGLGVVTGFFIMNRAGLVSKENAHKLVAEGALIVDVRSGQEFQSEHLPNAINIPLDRLKEKFPSAVPDKQKPVLLHCLSGGRSAMARSIVRKMGYSNAHNLGSLARARQLLQSV